MGLSQVDIIYEGLRIDYMSTLLFGLIPAAWAPLPLGPSYVASLHNDSRLIQQVIPWLSIQ